VITELEEVLPTPIVITVLVVAPTGDTAPAPLVVKRSPRLALKEPQLYESIEAGAVKLRGLHDALGGCTAALQKQVKKHSALSAHAKPLRKRAVAAIAASICASSSPVQAGSDV
jgi:hypothetical protein